MSNSPHDDDGESNHQTWRRVLGRGVRCICVWPQNHAQDTVAKMYHYLLNGDEEYAVIKVTRVSQGHSRRVRFDVFVANVDFTVALNHITDLAQVHRWHVRPHVPYLERMARRGARPTQDGSKQAGHEARAHIRVATLNVNGFRHKKHEIYAAAMRGRWDVLLLQETRIEEDSVDEVRLPGFNPVAGHAVAGGAHRGTAILVRKSLPLEPLLATANVTAARVFVGAQPLVVASVYVPTSAAHCRAARTQVLQQVGDFVHQSRQKHARTPMVLGGDFNTEPAALDAAVTKWNSDLQRLAVKGSNLTWHTPLVNGRPASQQQPPRRSARIRQRGNPAAPAVSAPAAAATADARPTPLRRSRRQARWSAIDHLLVSQPHAAGFTNARVDRRVDLSDHFAVVTSVAIEGLAPVQRPQPRTLITINAQKLKAADPRSIFGHNRFARLEEEWLSRNLTVDPITGFATDMKDGSRVDPAQELTEAIRDVCADQGVLANANAKQPRIVIVSKPTRNAIRARSLMSARLSRQQTVTDAEQVEYNSLVLAARRLVRKDRVRSWNKFVIKGLDFYRSGDSLGLWRWLKSAARRGSRGAAVASPLRDKDGNLQVTADGRLGVLVEHFAKLASAKTVTVVTLTTGKST